MVSLLKSINCEYTVNKGEYYFIRKKSGNIKQFYKYDHSIWDCKKPLCDCSKIAKSNLVDTSEGQACSFLDKLQCEYKIEKKFLNLIDMDNSYQHGRINLDIQDSKVKSYKMDGESEVCL